MTSKRYIPGEGPLGAKIAIVAEAPSYDEVQSGRPLTGPSGKLLNSLLKDAGINRDNVWVTNVCKYMVTPNFGKKKIPFWVRAAKDGINIDEQKAEIITELKQIRPNVILCLGGTALETLTGKDKISQWRGSIINTGLGKTIGTYHPAHLLHNELKGYWNKFVMVLDMKRAREESFEPEYSPPIRNLQVARNSSDLFQFYERYAKFSHVAVDIEARGQCIPVCIGLAFTSNHGMTVPLWNGPETINTSDSDMVSIWILLQHILSNHKIIGQNFNYDRDKLIRLGFGIPPAYDDVMMKAFTINPELPKGLAFNQSIYTREPYYKDEGMYHGSWNDLFLGCARDSCVTFEINTTQDYELREIKQEKFYRNFIMKLPELYREIETTGFVVNYDKRDQLLHKYVEWFERINYTLFTIAGDSININSPKQVASLLFDNWKLPLRNGTGEEELTSLLNLKAVDDPQQRKGIELILEGRRVYKTIGNYLCALPDYDGRMKTTCFPCLETGRSSNGQQEEPIRPTIEMKDWKGKKKKKSMGTAYQTITKHGDIGQDVRSMYGPDKGYVLVNIDSSQAEARVTSLLARDDRMLALYDTNDIHALTASWFLGGTEAEYSKKLLGYECSERFLGKTLRHSGERGAKARRAMTEVNTSARKYKINTRISEAEAERALQIFHQMCPNIKNVYFKEVTDVINRSRVLVAPLPYGIDADYGGRRTFYERYGDELFRQAFSYIPQRAVSDNTKAAGIRIKDNFPTARLVMESHDALLFMVRERELDDFIPIARNEMERPIDFRNCSLPRGLLSIPADVEIGENFQNLYKWKSKNNI